MARLVWNQTERAMNRRIVRLNPGIKEKNEDKAQKIAAQAERRMAPHHANNAADTRPSSSISVSTGIVDAYVNLNDPDGGALPIAYFLGALGVDAFPNSGSVRARRALSKAKRKGK